MKKISLHYQILAAIIFGGLFGFYLTEHVAYVDWMGTVFMRALRMIVAPLVFCSVMTGVASISASDSFLRLGGKTLGYAVFTSVAAIITGIVFVIWIKPGEGLNMVLPETSASLLNTQMTFRDFFINMMPDNVFSALSSNNMIGIIVFAVLFGVFLGKSTHQGSHKVLSAFEAINDVIMKLTTFILKFTPYGIFGLIAGLIATEASTPEHLRLMVESQGWYFLTIVGAIGFHLIVTLGILLYFVGGINPFRHIQRMKEVILMAFSTASSGGTLPLTLSHVKDRCKVSEKICNFYLPVGTTINKNGSALFMSVATIFIAQVYGLDLTFSKYLFILFASLMMAGIGAAGIPMASFVMTIILIQMLGLPAESIGLVLLAERFVDMARTSLNVYGNTVTAVLIAKSEGEAVEN